jgi:hypothetical protein
LQQWVDVTEAVLMLCLLLKTHHCHLMQQLTLFEDKVAWGILQTDTMISTVGKYV